MNKIMDQLFQAAIYLRLSKDDGDFSSAEEGKTESNSIHNQDGICQGYFLPQVRKSKK